MKQKNNSDAFLAFSRTFQFFAWTEIGILQLAENEISTEIFTLMWISLILYIIKP